MVLVCYVYKEVERHKELRTHNITCIYTGETDIHRWTNADYSSTEDNLNYSFHSSLEMFEIFLNNTEETTRCMGTSWVCYSRFNSFDESRGIWFGN